MKRHPAVAGQFYPKDKIELTRTLAEMCGSLPDERQEAVAVISPHAGYIYSGSVAGQTLARVSIPETVLILGPNHHGRGAPVALMDRGSWLMPMGEVDIDEELADKLLAQSSLVEVDETAHRSEHSLEVQVPFLQYLQANLSICPLVVSSLPYDSCERLGNDIAEAVKDLGRPVLIVASTDMTHYESRQAAAGKDRLAIDRILELDGLGLYQTVLGNRISMCGVMPSTVAIIAARGLKAEGVELVRYTDSGEVSGDTGQVVGYAGMIIR